MSTPTKRKADGGGMRSAKAKGSSANAALSPQTIEYLRGWMMSPEHIEHPYPDEHEKAIIMSDTGITAKQLTCWFSNNRKRFWKPKMEEMGRHAVVQAAMGNTLSPHTIEYLKGWMMHPDHIQNPYPTEEEKTQIMAATGIEKKQLTCWFSNNRKRFWRPKMDKLRADYGLSDTEPLPAALLATAASMTALAPTTVVANPPPPTLSNDLINDDILAADILAAVGCQPVVPIETTYALAQAPPLSTLDDHTSYGAPAADATAVAATTSTTQLPIETTYAPQDPPVAVTSFSPTMVAQQSMVALGEAFITHQQQFGVQEYNPLEGGGVAPVAALPLEGGDGRATLPLEDFSPSFFDQGGASVVDEVKQQQEGQQQPGNKRPKVSMDDGMVAV
mmetsp:Transcript_23696/g.49610  ORF Transcript_23696/g.49610 Transcript_23696/m.49610 type:complete len:390 (+) Transcript_23696:255-1424(+)